MAGDLLHRLIPEISEKVDTIGEVAILEAEILVTTTLEMEIMEQEI